MDSPSSSPPPPALPSSSDNSKIRQISSQTPPPRSKRSDTLSFSTLFEHKVVAPGPIDKLLLEYKSFLDQIYKAVKSPKELIAIGEKVRVFKRKIPPLKGQYWSNPEKFQKLDALQTKTLLLLNWLPLFIVREILKTGFDIKNLKT